MTLHYGPRTDQFCDETFEVEEDTMNDKEMTVEDEADKLLGEIFKSLTGVTQKVGLKLSVLIVAEALTEAEQRGYRLGQADVLGKLTLAKECFLNMIADADKWEVEVDGDVDGVTVTYRLEVEGFSFEQLPEALGIEPKYLETMEDAIARELDAPALPISPQQEGK